MARKIRRLWANFHYWFGKVIRECGVNLLYYWDVYWTLGEFASLLNGGVLGL